MVTRGHMCAAESRRKVEGKGLEVTLGGQNDNDHVLRGMMWAERLVCMVNDIFEELLDLDMEPKPESLWRTSTHKHEDMTTLRVGRRGTTWDRPFREVFEVRERIPRRRTNNMQGHGEFGGGTSSCTVRGRCPC